MGPRGCGLAVFGMQQQQAPFTTSPESIEQVHAQEQKTLTDLLMADQPSSEKTRCLRNVDMNLTDEQVLAAALGAPARRVLIRAELLGPRTGWRDGHLSGTHGFCPPDPSASPAALAASPGKSYWFHIHRSGRVWSDLCNRLPDVVRCGKAREIISKLPYVDVNAIPDTALWAAVVCLGILAHTYRYEEKYDGYEGDFR
jgi:hypothetical protein